MKTLTDEEALALGATHRHVKTGGYYRLSHLRVFDATNTSDGRLMRLYFPLVKSTESIDAYVRELAEFDDGRFAPLRGALAQGDRAQQWFSKRGFPLVHVGPPPRRGLLTCENYCKWYNLHVIHTDGAVQEVHFPESPLDSPPGESAYVDHVPNPNAVVKMANRLGLQIDEQALEMIAGRWFIEAQSKLTVTPQFQW